ncbi:MAG: hypothetical protein H0T92_16195 [Pyrinomonadaceae bacterium]|nr:hypothetical protein [Pyrinomonadaceae bacterium]
MILTSEFELTGSSFITTKFGGRMQTRRTTIEGNRYLIFYTFNEQPPSVAASTKDGESASPPEPRAKPTAEEERRV